MYTKNTSVMIDHLRGPIKKHDHYIDRCIKQARNFDRLENRDLIIRYVRDHKLMRGELTVLLKCLGANPENPAMETNSINDRPKRMRQSAPMNKGLPGMMVAWDRDILRDYLAMLEVSPISVTIEDKVVQHIAFLRKLLVYVSDYGGHIEGTEMESLNYRSKNNRNVWR